MKVSIIGCGLIGKERISAVKKISELTGNMFDVSVFDPNINALNKVKEKFDVQTYSNVDDILGNNPNWVFICTPHDAVLPTIKQAFSIGSNVLVEKPLGRTLKECEEILSYKPEKSSLYVGFNYRFFAGIEAALKDCRENKFGKLISVNMVLAHGNAPGMEKSWKLDPVKCGGGCFIDPGVHLMDLMLNISFGNLRVNKSMSWSGFWNTGIEEEAHVLLSDDNGTVFNTQISLNRWRSTFRMEINGTEGYGIVEGRGRSYGRQSYRTGKRWGWQDGKSQSDSEIIVVNKHNCEDSFLRETAYVLNQPIDNFASAACNDIEAHNVMSLLEKCRKND